MMIWSDTERVATLSAVSIVPTMEIQPHVSACVVESFAHLTGKIPWSMPRWKVASIKLDVIYLPVLESICILLVVGIGPSEGVMTGLWSDIGVQPKLQASKS